MATRSLNKVQLIGNLTRDPELRYTPQGTAVCTFGLATNRSWVPAGGGERREETEFHRIVSWQKLAELCAQLLFKGRKVFVEGRLQTRDWTASDGTQRRTTEIVIDDMIILDSKRPPIEGVPTQAEPFEGEAVLDEVSTEAAGASAPADTSAPAAATDDVQEPEKEEEKKRKTEKPEKVAEKKKEEKSSAGAKPKTAKSARTDKDKKEGLNADDIPF